MVCDDLFCSLLGIVFLLFSSSKLRITPLESHLRELAEITRAFIQTFEPTVYVDTAPGKAPESAGVGESRRRSS